MTNVSVRATVKPEGGAEAQLFWQVSYRVRAQVSRQLWHRVEDQLVQVDRPMWLLLREDNT